ncbi:hypothetical protein CNR22_03820 [Sphingobacteriaceae bacterium]|nr:hypothetical protein CNR22_03820 [Sphingobacteriaceae bacterium]
MRVKIFKAILFCLISFIHFRLVSQTDTAYIQSYYNKFVPRLLSAFKLHEIILDNYADANVNSSEEFSTNDQYFIGGDLSYKWITVGYSYGINLENTRKNLDLRFATTYKALNFQANYTRLNNLTYSYFDNTSFIEKQQFKPLNSEFYNYGFKVDYIFNYKKFCYSAGYTQGGRQIKTKGSFVATIAFSKNKFSTGDIPSSLNRDSVLFNELKLNAIEDWLGEVGLGYSYNWVIKKHLLIAVTELPCMGFQQLTLSRYNDKTKSYFRAPFVNHFKLGVVWHNRCFFTGVSSNVIWRASVVDKFDYSQLNVAANIYMGWVFSNVKRKRLMGA